MTRALLATLAALLMTLVGTGCAECDDGYTKAADGRCYENAETGIEGDADTDADSDADTDVNYTHTGTWVLVANETVAGIGQDTCTGTASTTLDGSDLTGEYECSFAGAFAQFPVQDTMTGTETGGAMSGTFSGSTPFTGTWDGTLGNSGGVDDGTASGTFSASEGGQEFGGTWTATFNTQ